MTTTVTITSEFKRREDLVNNVEFRKTCAKIAKEIGITAKEWNENKVIFLMMWANEICGIENKMNK